MDITITKDEIIEYKKMKTIGEITLLKEKITLFERKYNNTFEEFKKEMEKSEEDFEIWDDYIEWKAIREISIDLENKLVEFDNAKNIKIV